MHLVSSHAARQHQRAALRLRTCGTHAYWPHDWNSEPSLASGRSDGRCRRSGAGRGSHAAVQPYRIADAVLDLHLAKVPSEAGNGAGGRTSPDSREKGNSSLGCSEPQPRDCFGRAEPPRQTERAIQSNVYRTGRRDRSHKSYIVPFFFWRLGEHAVLPSGVTAPRHGARQTAGGRT